MSLSAPAYTSKAQDIQGAPAGAILAQRAIDAGFERLTVLVQPEHVSPVMFWLRRLHYKLHNYIPRVITMKQPADPAIYEEFRKSGEGYLVATSMVSDPNKMDFVDLRPLSAKLIRTEIEVAPFRKKRAHKGATKIDPTPVTRNTIAKMTAKDFHKMLIRNGHASPIECGKGQGVRLDRDTFRKRERMILDFMSTHERVSDDDPLMLVVKQHIYPGQHRFFRAGFVKEARAESTWMR